MIKCGTVVRYRRHNYSVYCVVHNGAYAIALIHTGNKEHTEVPLEQLEEIVK